jgi:hypothetical protein
MRSTRSTRRPTRAAATSTILVLFRTFDNPRGFGHEIGFWDGASARVLDTLLGRDVSRPASNRP